MTGPMRFVPWVIAGLGVLYLLITAIPPGDPDGEMKIREFATIPVQENGRIKPLDTYARIELMLISNRQEYTDEKDRSGQPAIRWLLNLEGDGMIRWLQHTGNKEIIAQLVDQVTEARKNQGNPHKTKVFRIENDQVLSMLGLKRREGLRYSYMEIASNEASFNRFQNYAEQAIMKRKNEEKLDLVETKSADLLNHLQTHQELAMLGGVHMVPSSGPRWKSLGEIMMHGEASEGGAALSLQKILLAYATGNVKMFNDEVDSYQSYVSKTMPTEAKLARLETWFNNFEPFYQCMCLYVLIFLLACLSWLCWWEALTRAALYLGVAVLITHTIALCLRMYIQGRPPVTNLYSSAVFIGWGCVLMCLFIEFLYRNSFGSVGAAVMGSCTLFIAHHLSGSGDTLEMMQAVLDTNFWLATHVVCVTFGYTATFVAGFFGLIYVILGVVTPVLNQQARKVFGQIIYGVVCFATLLSFVGTVLGGIWADQSWGRFWGWDPKENGALLIVIMNSLILHARWGGMIKDRGMAVLVMVGNMVTMWSWFGTNQLGIGLHSYGFNKALIQMCSCFWFVQLAFIGIGLLPVRYWWSFQAPIQPLTKNPKSRPSPRSGPRGSTGIIPAG